MLAWEEIVRGRPYIVFLWPDSKGGGTEREREREARYFCHGGRDCHYCSRSCGSLPLDKIGFFREGGREVKGYISYIAASY